MARRFASPGSAGLVCRPGVEVCHKLARFKFRMHVDAHTVRPPDNMIGEDRKSRLLKCGNGIIASHLYHGT
jgi:hypothetical protein